MEGNFNSLLVLNRKIKVCMGWDVSPPMGHVVSCKKLRDKGLNTFKGIIGYLKPMTKINIVVLRDLRYHRRKTMS
jgi:hypothetical protein